MRGKCWSSVVRWESLHISVNGSILGLNLSQQICFKYFPDGRHSFKRTFHICFLLYSPWHTARVRHWVSKKFRFLVFLSIRFGFFRWAKYATNTSNSKINVVSNEWATKTGYDDLKIYMLKQTMILTKMWANSCWFINLCVEKMRHLWWAWYCKKASLKNTIQRLIFKRGNNLLCPMWHTKYSWIFTRLS